MDRLPRATILVIDDDPTILDLTRDFLGGEGYRVVAVASHEAGLVALSAFRCALILSDTGEEMDRWAAPARILAAAGAAPVVIFSAHDPHIFAHYAPRGFAGVIAKPFDLDALLDTVKALLSEGQKAA